MHNTTTRSPAPGLRRLAMYFFIALLAGCASQSGRWTQDDYHLGYGPPFMDRQNLSEPAQSTETAGGLEPISQRLILVADNQRHELLGSSIFGLRMAIADEQVKEVAIRPPQLDLFGQSLLVEALDRTDGFVLHLGDACDVSNTVEFALFAWDMRAAEDGWVMAPGNHDGYFMGNTSRIGSRWLREWNRTAEQYDHDQARIVSRAMQKDDYICYYLASMVLQDASWSAPLAARLGPACESIYQDWKRLAGEKPPTFSAYWQHLEKLQESISRSAASSADMQAQRITFEQSQDGKVALRRIAWAIDSDSPWKSYIVQEVDISSADSPLPVSVIVLDTSQYTYIPSAESAAVSALFSLGGLLFPLQLAGVHGNILASQEQGVQWMVDAMRDEKRRWMLATHHRYHDLGRLSRPRFQDMRAEGGVPFVLSAHSHAGELFWHEDAGRDGAWLELNVDSMLDAPVAYRDFQLHQLGDRLVATSNRYVMADELRRDGLLAEGVPGYRPSKGDPDDYMNYRLGWTFSSDASELAVKRVLLAAYLRMFRLFDTADGAGNNAAWPTLLDGTKLASHDRVLQEIQRFVVMEMDEIDIDELTHLLYQLREYDRTRPLEEADRQAMRAYRLSQAIWAGRAEKQKWEFKPYENDPDLSYFLLPAGTAARPE